MPGVQIAGSGFEVIGAGQSDEENAEIDNLIGSRSPAIISPLDTPRLSWKLRVFLGAAFCFTVGFFGGLSLKKIHWSKLFARDGDMTHPYSGNMSEVKEMLRQFPGQEHCVFQAGEKDAALVPGLSGRSHSLALKESIGFYNESDEMWIRRKQRHIHQMCLQGQLMNSCPANVFATACYPGCVPFPAIQGCPPSHFWQAHYEPSFSCAFERRLGLQGEGGKWVCDPYKIRKQVSDGGGCLVYSIGSNGQYDFEKSMHDSVSSHCEIHTVDMNNWSHYTKRAPPPYVRYHVHKVGLPPGARSMPTIVEELGHGGRTIDIFKIDCEGCEWASFKSWFGQGVQIRQILVELHQVKAETHAFFKYLFDLGYVVFHKEPNTFGCDGGCLEYAFLKLTPDFSRARSV